MGSNPIGGTVLDCLARWRSLCLMARFARCDVRGEPPSSSDPTKRLCRRISSVLDAFRRLLLQIGGANIAGAERAGKPPSSLSLGPPQHGGARSGIGLPRSLALALRCKPRRLSAQGHEFSSDRAHSLLICGLVRRTASAQSASKHHSFFKAWKKGWSSFVHLN
jgi:hypothetical protein